MVLVVVPLFLPCVLVASYLGLWSVRRMKRRLFAGPVACFVTLLAMYPLILIGWLALFSRDLPERGDLYITMVIEYIYCFPTLPVVAAIGWGVKPVPDSMSEPIPAQ